MHIVVLTILKIVKEKTINNETYANKLLSVLDRNNDENGDPRRAGYGPERGFWMDTEKQ
jgi:hypothetical protein